jgi:Domain of Unknown Function with PDB structure (DUF3857)/Transglutaminase-like superfamily
LKLSGGVFALALLASCAGRWEALDRASLPPPAEHDPTSIVLLDDTEVRFDSDARGRPIADVTEHVRYLILREADAPALSKVWVQYAAPFSTVTSFAARSIAPDGRVQELSRRDASDVMAYPAWMLYSDMRALTLEVKPARPGTVIEVRYSLRFTDPRRFHFMQVFGRELPAKETRLRVSAPSGWSIDALARRLDAPVEWAPTVEEDHGRRVSTWERRDLPALPTERWAPHSDRRATTVRVRLGRWLEGKSEHRAFANARELSAFLADYQKPEPPGPAERELAARALEGVADDPTAKARRLYAWTRDHILYCAIHIGEGGWIPHPAGDVARLQYGDCKDKANLLRALLAAAGVNSRLAAIYSHDGYPVPFGLPSLWGNFNHAILMIDLPAGPMIVDPTSRAAPFGELPIGDQEADLLPVAPGGADLVRTPGSPPEENSLDEEVSLTLGDGSDVEGQFRYSATGAWASHLREVLLHDSVARRNDTLAQWLDVRISRVTGLELDGLEPSETPTPLVARGRLSIAHAGSRLVRLPDLIDPWASPLPDEKRTEPVVFKQRYHKRQRVTLHLPGEASTLPQPAEIDSPLGHYRLTWTAEPHTIVVEREMTLRERVVPPERYRELRGFFDAIVAAEAHAASLKP